MINFLTLSFRAKKIVRWRTIITVEIAWPTIILLGVALLVASTLVLITITELRTLLVGP